MVDQGKATIFVRGKETWKSELWKIDPGISAARSAESRGKNICGEGQRKIGVKISFCGDLLDGCHKKRTTNGLEVRPQCGHKTSECARRSRRVDGQKHTWGPLPASLPRTKCEVKFKPTDIQTKMSSMDCLSYQVGTLELPLVAGVIVVPSCR